MAFSSEQLHQNFKRLLQALNPAQREAVAQLEGPVLVLAGPGTGKTHVLAARIANILVETDARPQNILCLTFTEAGVLAMRKRLLEMIGPEAYRIPIFTFHGFCNRVIQENLEFFSRGEIEPIRELERIELIRNLLEELPPQHPLRQGKKDLFAYETHVKNLFSVMKREAWKPGYIQQQIRIFLQEIPQNPEYQYKTNTRYGKKGEPRASLIRNLTERMDLLHATADLFPVYEKKLREKGLYEFDDMLLWVLNAFEKNETLLRNYQERYQYFLVDEYQDTNTAQYHLLRQLLDYWDSPNVFIVGDDDQSIFEFQGARLQNLVLFYRHHKQNLLPVVLQKNYRSSQAILDAADRLINENTLRAVNALEVPLEKKLLAQNPGQAPPQLLCYDNALQEATGILQNIVALHTAGVPYNEIAVLYPKHKQGETLLALLQNKNIPYQTKRPVDTLQLPLVRQLLEILYYLRDEQRESFSGDYRLFKILHATYWNLPPIDLARIALFLRNRKEQGGAPTPWREALKDQALLASLQLDTPLDGWRHLSECLEQWIADGMTLSVGLLIEKIINQSGMLATVLEHPDKNWWVQILHSFLTFALDESGRDAQLTLPRFLELLSNMEDNRLPLPVLQTMQTGQGIQLLTVHSAKGLEFEHVFMMDCTADQWEPSARAQQFQFRLPDTLTISSQEEDALEARRRLFYVAMTRAKTGLYLSYARFNKEGKPLSPACFLAETGIPETQVETLSEQVSQTQTILLQQNETPVASLPDGEQLTMALEQFQLSISSMNRYLRCPLAFYYESILQIPSASSEAAIFGQAMHHAAQQYFLKLKSSARNEWPEAAVLTHEFVHALQKRKGYFTAASFEQRKALGTDFLERYHHEQIHHWRRRAVAERHIDRAEYNGVPLTGTLDKIEWLDDGSIRIVDYKTGKPEKKKISPPSAEKPLGSEFWRQLGFYKILLETAHIYPEPVSKTAISWLEPDAAGRFPYDEILFKPEEIAFIQHLIVDTYAKIMNREFDTGCNEPDCDWCRLHRERKLPERFVNNEEDLDDFNN